MSARFTAHYLLENLRDIYFAERTGSLTLCRGNEWRRLFFDRGMVAMADSSQEGENLIPILVREGKVSAEQQRASSETPILDLAAGLVSNGVVSPTDLDAAGRSVVEQVVVGAFGWDGGTYKFDDHPVTPTVFNPDVLFTFDVFMRGVQAMTNFDPLKQVLMAQERKLCLNENAFLPIYSLSIGAKQGYVLSRVDGTLRIQDVAVLAPGGEEEEVLRLLFGFLVLGLVQFDPPLGEGLFSLSNLMAEHRDDTKKDHDDRRRVKDFVNRTRGKKPGEILGTSPGAGSVALKKAYEALRDQFRRDAYSPRLRAELKRDLSLIENRLLEAYLVLQTAAIQNLSPVTEISATDLTASKDKRMEFIKTEAQAGKEEKERMAEQHFLKAKDYYKQSDFYNCIQFCKLAVKENPHEAPFFGLMGDALLHNPDTKWQRLAEDSYRKALEIDPWNADYLVCLGRLYRKQGLATRARRHFEMALEILPAHTEAQEELGSLS